MSEAAAPSSPFQPSAVAADLREGDAAADSPAPAGQQNGSGQHTEGNQANGRPQPAGTSEQAEPPADLPEFTVGWAQSAGNRPYQDDRCVKFALQLPVGGSAQVWAVADGHHQHYVSQLVCDELEGALREAVQQHDNLEQALRATIRRLDDCVFARHNQGQLKTGGTTLIVHVLTSTHVYTANVGDCKSVLSSRGACVELNTCHNPNVPSERDRFQAVGIYCSADHIGGSDINVCRTLGDYDLGMPLKFRDEQGRQAGPLISEPDVCVHSLDDLSEFVITASDGLWDYYSPESSVLSDTRRMLRKYQEDPQRVAEWLLDEALKNQRRMLHAGTPGDNVTVMVVRLRALPPVPRSTTSRLNLRAAGSGDLTSGKLADLPEGNSGELQPSGSMEERHQQLQRQASYQESLLRRHSTQTSIDQLQDQDQQPQPHPPQHQQAQAGEQNGDTQ